MKIIAAYALAESVKNLNPEAIIPDVLDKSVARHVAKSVKHHLRVFCENKTFYLLSAFIVIFCFGLNSSYASNEKHVLISQLIIQILNNDHLTPQKFDNNFSKRVFSQFIDKLDPNKQFFTKDAIDSLRKYEETIDNNLLKGEFTTIAIITNLKDCKTVKIS